MAIDWLKIEHCLPDKPEVVAMANQLAMDRYAVAGRLLAVWTWFDRHTVDGTAPGVTPAFIDSLVAQELFAAAMTAVGWLSLRNGSLAVPKFSRHISKSAKARALAAERVQRSRNAPSVTKPLPDNISISHSPSKSKSDSDSSFDLFWNAFPKGRRKAKGDALKSWKTARAKVSAESLISAATDYAESEEGRGQFVKMPSTWLNQECWDDDRESWRSKRDDDPRGSMELLERLSEKRRQNGQEIDEG